MRTALSSALKQFLKTTTLHGFKYFNSPYYFDRVLWALCAVLSASCAAGLVAVLWARFTEQPALLALHDVRLGHLSEPVPLIAVCPTPETIARLLADHLSLNKSETKWLPVLLGRMLRDVKPEVGHLQLLEELLTARNLTLSQALLGSVPACTKMVTRCRWQDTMVPCKEILNKQTTHWGVCCTVKNRVLEEKFNYEGLNKNLAMTLQCDDHCSDSKTCENCFQFFTRYHGEVESPPKALAAGHQYHAHIFFTGEGNHNSENIVEGTCVSDPEYSQKQCLINCGERFCGCSDPLRIIVPNERANVLPPCSVLRISCLKKWKNENTCQCLQACKKRISDTTMETSALDALSCSVDSFYAGLNSATSIVLHIHVKVTKSKQYERISTETSLTLLSSLGGVFNMFLGVGLFSALEFIFFIFVRLPNAVRRSPEMDTTVHRIPTVVLPRNRKF